jgi:hypothetical protein
MTRIVTTAVPARRPGIPLRAAAQPRPRLSADVIAGLAARVTPRDLWLLRMLAEHQVLTSTQIAQLAFGSAATARHRLIRLWRMRAVDRVQPFTASGSAPMHYVLGDAGAAVLAERAGTTPKDAGYRRERALAVFASVRLSHATGASGVMTALIATARTRPGSALAAWWPERRCVVQWGTIARPDAYGRWHEDGQDDTDFFLEFDTGTEDAARVSAKLPGYAALARTTGITTPVLFWFPSATREAAVRPALSGTRVPAATASPASDASPADAVWLPVGRDGPRLPLPALAIPPPRARSGPAATAPAPPPEPSLTGGPVPPMPPP